MNKKANNKSHQEIKTKINKYNKKILYSASSLSNLLHFEFNKLFKIRDDAIFIT